MTSSRRYVRSYPPLCEESSPLWLESVGVVSGVPSSLCLDPANRSASRYEAQRPYKSFEKPESSSRFLSAAGGRAAKRTSEFLARNRGQSPRDRVKAISHGDHHGDRVRSDFRLHADMFRLFASLLIALLRSTKFDIVVRLSCAWHHS